MQMILLIQRKKYNKRSKYIRLGETYNEACVFPLFTDVGGCTRRPH